MATTTKLPNERTRSGGWTSRLWLLIAVVAMIATACGNQADSVTDAAEATSFTAADGAVEAEEAMEDEEEAFEAEEVVSGDDTLETADFNEIADTDGAPVAAQDEPAEDDATRDDQQLCLLYTSPSPRDRQKSRMPSSA